MSNCGCCACLAGAGPRHSVANRPGLSALHYRIGTHGTFFDEMIRRLTVPVDGVTANYSLHSLTTRETDDPAIAFLDAWATVGDVLTFYQERIANEGFLRTALERRSVLELGRLVGYKLKPGVSASVHLAYTVDDPVQTIIPAGSKSQSIPGAGEQAQMFETSYDFEARGVWNAMKPRLTTPQDITLDNVLTIPSVWIKGTTKRVDVGDTLLFVFQESNDKGSLPRAIYAVRRVLSVTLDTEADRTDIALETLRPYYLGLYQAVMNRSKLPFATPPPAPTPLETPRSRKKKTASTSLSEAEASTGNQSSEELVLALRDQILLGTTRDDLQIFVSPLTKGEPALVQFIVAQEAKEPLRDLTTTPLNVNTLVQRLAAPPGVAPASEWQFGRTLATSFTRSSDYITRLVGAFLPETAYALYGTLAAAASDTRPESNVAFESLHILRRRSAAFGYNAPTILFEERPTTEQGKNGNSQDLVALPMPQTITEERHVLFLDAPAESLSRGSYVLARRRQSFAEPYRLAVVATAREIETQPRTAYTVSARTTRVGLDVEWAEFRENPDTLDDMIDNLKILRSASIFTESEELELVQRPLRRHVGRNLDDDELDESDESETRIALDRVVEGLKPGRFVIVTGERIETGSAKGIIGAELAMIANVELTPDAGAGGSAYSVLVLVSDGLEYRYKRSTVIIYGNVVKATHGQTFTQILGSGDSAKPLQTFNLNQKPLTYVSAPTTEGVVSTLAVRVNDILWHETDSFFGTEAADRIFVTKIADDGTVSVTFGNGREGARVPSGPDNVRAVYRAFLGKAGNVRPKQIATAISRPLGVKDVINPIAASGGTNPELRDDARKNIPVSLQAMGRVVSVRDFADFARTFGGISKAVAVALTDGRRRIVHLTVGGAEDVELTQDSDLYKNLLEALRKYGDPYQPFVVSPREKLVMAGSANVRVHPDFLWANVAPQIQATLVDVFSYDRRDFGQVVFPSEVTAAIQSVAGVEYVDLETLGGIEQEQIIDETETKAEFGLPDIVDIRPIVPKGARLNATGSDFFGAQIGYLPPALADLFILTEIEDEP